MFEDSPSKGSFSLLILKNMPIYYLTKKKLEELEQEYENLKKLKQEKFKEGAPAFLKEKILTLSLLLMKRGWKD